MLLARRIVRPLQRDPLLLRRQRMFCTSSEDIAPPKMPYEQLQVNFIGR